MGQIGAFFSAANAQQCLAQLVAEGRDDLRINMIPVHSRVKDWHFDR